MVRESQMLEVVLSQLFSDCTMAIGAARSKDRLLSFVNREFTKLTGYSLREAYMKPCLFLQGPASDPGAIATLQQALKQGQSVVQDILNYKKSGEVFYNRFTLLMVQYQGTGYIICLLLPMTEEQFRPGPSPLAGTEIEHRLLNPLQSMLLTYAQNDREHHNGQKIQHHLDRFHQAVTSL